MPRTGEGADGELIFTADRVSVLQHELVLEVMVVVIVQHERTSCP